MLELIKLSSSLRSQLSRNALSTISDLFENLKKGIDFNVDDIVPSLIKNAGHTNHFIAEEAEKALISACHNATQHKVIAAALTLSDSRTNAVKQKSMMALHIVIDRMQLKVNTFRDLEWVAKAFGKGLMEAAVEVREEAKRGLLVLKQAMDSRDMDQVLKRCLRDREYERVQDFFNKEVTHAERFIVTNAWKKSSSVIKSKSKPRIVKKDSLKQSPPKYGQTSGQFEKSKYGKTSGGFEVIDPGTLAEWEEVWNGFKRGDWEQRLTALDQLASFISSHESLLQTSKKFSAIVDLLSECLGDNNSRVVSQA